MLDRFPRSLPHSGALALVASALWLAACGPSYPNCSNDSTCKAKGEYCVNSKCAECRVNDHCAAKGACYDCVAGACEKRPGCCESDGDCGTGKTCTNNRCTESCATDADCGPGETCAGGACVAKSAAPANVSCGSDADCPDGQKCKDGACEGPCEVETVFFEFDDYTLGSSAQSTLEANVACLKEKGVRRIRIEGHCDERGTDAYNMELGNRRARAVKKYLQRLDRKLKVKTISYGKTRPNCSSADESCWSQNRRGVITFKSR